MERQIDNMNIKTLILDTVLANCYIISNIDTNEAIIIDPADKAEVIIDYIKQAKLTVVGIFLTHGHFDHIMAAEKLKKFFRIGIHANKNETELLANAQMNCSADIGREISVFIDDALQDGDLISLAGFDIKAIHTPGHTAGGTCYHFMNYGVLISGDTLFYGTIGRADLPTGDFSVLLDSVKNKLAILDEETLVLPGHGQSTTIGYEKINNPYITGDEELWD